MPRTLGATNKNKRGLLARLQQDFPNYHPIVEMARVANDPNADPQARFAANKEVAKYVTPQLKAVDLTGDLGLEHRFTTNVVGTDD